MNWEQVMLLFQTHNKVIFRLEGVGESVGESVGEQEFYAEDIFNVIRDEMDLLDEQNESLRLDVRDSILEEERLNSYIDSLENHIDNLEREISELRGEN